MFRKPAAVLVVAVFLFSPHISSAQTDRPASGASAPGPASNDEAVYVPSPSVVDTMTVAQAREIVRNRLTKLGAPGLKPSQMSDIRFTASNLSGRRGGSLEVWIEGRIAYGFSLEGLDRQLAVDGKRSIVRDGGFDLASVKNPALRAQLKELADALLVLRLRSSMQTDPIYQRRFDEAAQVYRAAATKPQLPEDTRRYWVQADAAALQDKQLARAVELYEQALEIAPWWPDGHFNLAHVLSQMDEFAGAIVEMKRYLALVPEAPDARAMQDKIYEWEGKLR